MVAGQFEGIPWEKSCKLSSLPSRSFKDRRYLLQFEVGLRNFGTGPADILDYIVETEMFDPPKGGAFRFPAVHGA
jgi:hypothetical protein